MPSSPPQTSPFHASSLLKRKAFTTQTPPNSSLSASYKTLRSTQLLPRPELNTMNPFGHHHHHHHHRRDEDDEEPSRYPPPGYHHERPAEFGAPPPPFADNPYGPPGYPPVQRPGYEAPAPPYFGGPPGYDDPPHGYEAPHRPSHNVEHVSHQVEYGYEAPHRPSHNVEHVSHQVEYGYDAPHRPSPNVEHVGHEVMHGYDAPPAYGQPYEAAPYRPSPNVEHVAHENWGAANERRTVRVFTKAKEDFALTIRDGKVVLAPANPRDEYQHWIKDMKYSTKVKDEEGLPSFALVNKVTGEAIKHSVKATHPVRLVPYNPDYLDESVLWTESHDTGEGFRCIRMVNNITLNFDAFHGDKDHGGVRDGTNVVLWEWTKGNNQRWKIIPY